MFNLFKKKTPEKSPEDCKQEYVPKEEPEVRYYSVGPTSHGRVMFKVAYGNVSLNELGIDNLIKALEASKMWLDENNRRPENRAPEVPESL